MWGLGILIAAQYFVTVMILYLSESLGNSPPTIQESLPSILATTTALVYVYIWRKTILPKKLSLIQFEALSNFKMVTEYAGSFFSFLSQGVTSINKLIEGRGAFFWALLFLTLLVSILSRLNIGGE
jgi:hypothetical protein